MKKLKTLLIGLLALGGLTACNKHVHTFVEWASDEGTHWHVCECGETDEAAPHDFTGEYQCDEEGHWQVCECGVAGPKENHVFEREYDEDLELNVFTCKFCGYNYSEDTKLAWTSNEKTLMGKALLNVLPFVPGYDLALDEENSGEMLVFSGLKATEKDVDAYAEAFMEAGYENIEATRDAADVWTFHNDYFYQFRKPRDVESGYLPLYYDSVLVGLTAGTKQMTVIATFSYCFNDDFGLNSEGQFSAFYVTEKYSVASMFNSCGVRAVSVAASILGKTYGNQIPVPSTSFGTKSDMTATNGVGYLGLIDHQWNYPWTLGNIYSENFMVYVEFLLSGGNTDETTYVASDVDEYAAALVEAGFVADEKEPSEYSLEVEGLGTLIVVVAFYEAEQMLPKASIDLTVVFIPEITEE